MRGMTGRTSTGTARSSRRASRTPGTDEATDPSAQPSVVFPARGAPSRYGRAPSGIRNRALLAVLFRSGLRVSEALALFPKDLDPSGGTLRVLHGKGNKARTAPLPTD